MQNDWTLHETTAGASANTTLRRFVFRVLETAKENDTASRIVDVVLICFIAGSVVAVILESVPSIGARYKAAFYSFELLTISIFSVEYLLRLWSSVERDVEAMHPLRTRLRFMRSFHSVVDLLAILPFYVLALGLFGTPDMRFLRAVRLLRVLKLTRYSSALNMLLNTISENARALLASFMILVTVMLLAASGMYYFERTAQPVDFGSIPAAMWWAFSTLTTVGYGDVTPTTAGGKVFGAMIAVVGIGMVALPTSILASGYSAQLRQGAEQYRSQTDSALEDGVLSDDEIEELETLRVELGISRHTATQILDEETVAAAMRKDSEQSRCPHCGHATPQPTEA